MIKMICKECGSKDVTAQGWVAWDENTQAWKYTGETTLLPDWCNDCDDETTIEETA